MFCKKTVNYIGLEYKIKAQCLFTIRLILNWLQLDWLSIRSYIHVSFQYLYFKTSLNFQSYTLCGRKPSSEKIIFFNTKKISR